VNFSSRLCRPFWFRTVKLRDRMVLTYSLLVCVFVVLLSVVTDRFASTLFLGFVSDSADQQSWQVAASVARQFSGEAGAFDLAALRAVAQNHAREGFFVTVEDSEGNVVLDARFWDVGFLPGMGSRIPPPGGGGWFSRGRGGSLPSGDPSGSRYRGLSFPMTYGGEPIGRVIVETRAPFLLDGSQAAFIASLQNFLLWIGGAFALSGVVITAVLAGTLSRPILKAAGAAMRIADGEWSARVPEGQRTREVSELSRSINHLAATLERGDIWQKRLTTDVAHELRTPLATLQGNMEAMIDGVWEPSPERLASCHEEITRLSRLVADLGRLSLLERKDIAISRAELDLRALLEGAVGQFEGEARGKGVALSLAPRAPGFPREPAVDADRDRLKQVFVNLLSNAIKYTDSGGGVEVVLRGGADSCSVTVSDTGIGIPAEELPHVFDRFFRSDRSRSRETGGAGIGLTIASAIVSAHGGRMEVSSEPGRGSVFTVFLPRR